MRIPALLLTSFLLFIYRSLAETLHTHTEGYISPDTPVRAKKWMLAEKEAHMYVSSSSSSSTTPAVSLFSECSHATQVL